MEALEGQKNKAIVYSKPGTTETKVVELPIEAPGSGQVLVRLLYSGVCHTDYSFCTNAWKLPFPTPEGLYVCNNRSTRGLNKIQGKLEAMRA